jgi:glycosyltransferase involved in cell wall biosynthesis
MVHRSNPLPALDERPVVAIYRSPLFNASESFVQAHAAGLTRYQPLLVGLEDKGNARPELHDRLVTAASAGEATAFRLLGTAGLAERLRPAAPRLVHAHFATDGLLALPLARALGVPLVTTFHGYDIGRSRLAMLASGRLSWMRYALRRRRLIERGDLFLAVSDAVRTGALAQGYPADRTRTHYLGVDLSRFAGGAMPEPGLVLHVGRLVEKKGTAVLIAAMARLPEARLIVIGDGPLRGALERQATALGGRVRFLGALPSDEVAGWMSRAWLLAAPSVTARDGDAEGLPTVIAEAAAAALPTVGTRHAGIPEAVVDGETGFLAAERDVEGLAARIAELLGSRLLRDRMGEAARRLAAARFDGARQSAQLEEIYDGLLGQIRSWRSR